MPRELVRTPTVPDAPPLRAPPLPVPQGQGLTHLLKDGYQVHSGVEEAVMRNIEACKQLSVITRTSLGPNGGFG